MYLRIYLAKCGRINPRSNMHCRTFWSFDPAFGPTGPQPGCYRMHHACEWWGPVWGGEYVFIVTRTRIEYALHVRCVPLYLSIFLFLFCSQLGLKAWAAWPLSPETEKLFFLFTRIGPHGPGSM